MPTPPRPSKPSAKVFCSRSRSQAGREFVDCLLFFHLVVGHSSINVLVFVLIFSVFVFAVFSVVTSSVSPPNVVVGHVSFYFINIY